jgi:8-oxo-dGTP pyrophosphatase MutT (NUDIX family)
VSDVAGSRPEPFGRSIVAVVLHRCGRIGLFRRSALVGSDPGRWHCVTGYLETGTPLENAVRELREETGLGRADLVSVAAGPVLSLPGTPGPPWRVHTFFAETHRRSLTLNWEHDCYAWVRPEELRQTGEYDARVPWLGAVLAARGLNGC